jgi:hypothetical protein
MQRKQWNPPTKKLKEKKASTRRDHPSIQNFLFFGLTQLRSHALSVD